MSLMPTSSAAPTHMDFAVEGDRRAELRALVEKELAPGESIRWFGQPIAARLAMQSVPAVLFGVPWTAFSLFWMFGVGQASWLFATFGLPFVLMGLGMLTAPWWALRQAHRTAYVVTNRRALIVTTSEGLCSSAPGPHVSVRSFSPALLRDVERREQPDRSGDLVISRHLPHDGDACGHRPAVEAGFMAVANVKEAERHLRALTDRLPA